MVAIGTRPCSVAQARLASTNAAAPSEMVEALPAVTVCGLAVRVMTGGGGSGEALILRAGAPRHPAVLQLLIDHKGDLEAKDNQVSICSAVPIPHR